MTSFNKFIFERSLDYWFLEISYFQYVDIWDGGYGCPLLYDRSVNIVGG